MAKNIYVGNLAWAATADDLLELFGKFGKVGRAQVITDRTRPGYVEDDVELFASTHEILLRVVDDLVGAE